MTESRTAHCSFTEKNDNVSYDLPAGCGSFWKLNEADIKSRRTSISSSPSSTNGVGEAGVETIGILKTFSLRDLETFLK